MRGTVLLATDVIPEKQQVHQLVDRLAPSQVSAVRRLLEAKELDSQCLLMLVAEARISR